MPDKSQSSKRAVPAEVEPEEKQSAEASAAAVPVPGAARKIYPIVKYGDPILEKSTASVAKFDEELEQLAEDMFASMYAAQGVGLAAPQIGLGIRIAVVDVTSGKNPEAKIVLVNPEVIHFEGEKREEEGCLSIPGFRGYVVRPQFVTVRAQNAKGEKPTCDARNLHSSWRAKSRESPGGKRSRRLSQCQSSRLKRRPSCWKTARRVQRCQNNRVT